MPTLVCRNCNYRAVVSETVGRLGMMCPECHGGNLKKVDNRRRKGGRDVGIRPGSIRLVIGGVVLLVLGGAAFLWGCQNWNAGRFGARMLGTGVVLLIGGAVSILTGGIGIIRDLID